MKHQPTYIPPKPQQPDSMAKALDTFVRRENETKEVHHARQIVAYQETLATAELLHQKEPTRAHAENVREVKQELRMLLTAPLAIGYQTMMAITKFGFTAPGEAMALLQAHANLIEPSTPIENARRIIDAAVAAQAEADYDPAAH